MKSLLTKIIAALIVVAALGGCATVGDQEGALEYFDRTEVLSTGD